MDVCSLIVYLDSKGSIEEEEEEDEEGRGDEVEEKRCFNKYMLAWIEEGNKHIKQCSCYLLFGRRVIIGRRWSPQS